MRFAGGLFALYIFFNGLERFWIEKIRVNNVLEFAGSELPRQSSSRWDLCCSAWHLWPSSGNDPETGRSDIYRLSSLGHASVIKEKAFQASGYIIISGFSKFDNYLISNHFGLYVSEKPPLTAGFTGICLASSAAFGPAGC